MVTVNEEKFRGLLTLNNTEEKRNDIMGMLFACIEDSSQLESIVGMQAAELKKKIIEIHHNWKKENVKAFLLDHDFPEADKRSEILADRILELFNQSKKKQFRLSGDLQREYTRHRQYFGGNESEFIRQLISEAIETRNQKELENLE